MAGGLLRSTRALIEQLPAFGGGREGIALPFQFIFDGSDGLRLFVANTVPNQTIRLTGRWLESGSDEVQAFTQDFAHSALPTEQTFHFGLGRGVLLNVLVMAIGTITPRGRCYVRVDVERGSNAHVTIGTLLAGYAATDGGRAWPGSPLESALDGRGYVHIEQGAVPAPGVAALLTMPAAARWRVLSVFAALTTSAAAGTRRAFVTLQQDGTNAFFGASSRPQIAGESVTHNFAPGGAFPEGSGVFEGQGPLPVGLELQSSFAPVTALSLSHVGVDPADQWNQVTALIEEWRNPITNPL